MDLFLDNTYKGFFLELLADYLQLKITSNLNTIKLSPQSLSLVDQKEITFPALPLLVEESKKKFTSALSIALFLVEKSRTKHLLVGQTKDDLLTVKMEYEIV